MANNSFVLFLPSELQVIINEQSGKANQLTATFILRKLIEDYREEIISKFGEPTFNALVSRYSKDVKTQAREKLERETEKQAKREERLKLKKESLELKKKELEIRENNSAVRTEKIVEQQESEKDEEYFRITRRITEIEKILNSTIHTFEHKQELRVELEQLQKRKAELETPSQKKGDV